MNVEILHTAMGSIFNRVNGLVDFVMLHWEYKLEQIKFEW